MAIDIHTHIVPASFPAYVGAAGSGRWPQMQACDHPGHRTVMIGDKPFRTVSDHSWDIARRLEDMDAEGVQKQVLSPMPELLSYWFDADDALAMGSHVNATIAAMVAADPLHFAGLGMVPLQDPELAAKQMQTLRRDYGLVGVEVGSNINGKPIGHPDHAPFFAAAVENELAVFVHALHPAGADRVIGPPLLQALIAFPNENAFAVASMITGGLLEQFPDLRIGFSHGGGSFGLVLPRLQSGWETTRADDAFLPRPPVEYARRMYYDTLVYDDLALRYLISLYGADRLLVGSDYPFVIRERAPGKRIIGLDLPVAERDAILRGNAVDYLHI
ncbi:amidohydrolase family protein [Immundisolibacter sp.]|uniref:amidohydrolase family protein n=1 Tax=Immundisolibacter sp. TaxID=1934948 RepID=UPI0035670DAE